MKAYWLTRTVFLQVAAAASPPQMFLPSTGEKHDMHNPLDENISKREYILGITDEELANLPIIYIESFYATLSPGNFSICFKIDSLVYFQQTCCNMLLEGRMRDSPHKIFLFFAFKNSGVVKKT